MLDKLETVGLISGVRRYAISHIAIKSRQVVRDKRPFFLLEGELLKVEDFSQRLFERDGYRVFSGDDAHLFFSILSFNFRDSFFYEVCKNWVGHDAEIHLGALETAVSKCLDQCHVTEELIREAGVILNKYYAAYPPKQAVHLAIGELTRTFNPELLLNLLRFYRATGYTTKGAPDLFIIRDSDFWFVEVKSQNDSLSPEQYDFFEGFIKMVGENILVLRLLPTSA